MLEICSTTITTVVFSSQLMVFTTSIARYVMLFPLLNSTVPRYQWSDSENHCCLVLAHSRVGHLLFQWHETETVFNREMSDV